ncbi:glycosyl hydrolases family 31-domain-containing protein [Aspergillus undulatus]|uniref:glycosyl hydrolases family 31-domain-containing protein n=1 Tax=Aspergillus undulatus TaxID=1810928 RepID=UPI003CCD69C8
MVKFSHGCWHPAADTLIDWAVETISSKPINHQGDTLNNPNLSHFLDSPIDNVLHLSSTHWKTKKSVTQGPHFELFPGEKPDRVSTAHTQKTAESLNLEEGQQTASVDTCPKSFDISFEARGRLLTRLGWRSVGYVKQGTTALHPRANYLDSNRGQRWVIYQLHLGFGDHVYGLGERFDRFATNGQSIQIWNEDGGTGSELTYKNIPFFMASAGYGVFIPTSNFISFEIQSERTTRFNIAVPVRLVAMYLVYGPNPKSIIERYTTITGIPALPPAWTFGLWLSTSFTTGYDEGTITSFLDGMAEHDIPFSVFHFDCFWMPGFKWCEYEFDKDNFPDAKGQLQRIKSRGIHIHIVCVWINPYTVQESSIFDEAADNGYLLKRTDGRVWQYGFWQAGMEFVDFANPDACRWYQGKLQALIDMGVDSFKTDFGERIPTGDVVYSDGSSPEKMHNYYPFLYNKVTIEVLERNFGQHKATLFARSATAGCQRFPVHWGGDPYSNFEAIAETLRGGMSLTLCGFGYWAHDIGGFESKPDPALLKRWNAFGLFSSHSRLHPSGSFRVPWLIDKTGEADKTGVRMLRAPFLEYPDDPIAWHLDTQYFFGQSLLVAPIFNVHGEAQYYIPSGEWYGILDGKMRSGGRYVTEKHDFFSLPVLLWPGSAIFPSGHEDLDSVMYDWSKEVELLVNFAHGMDTIARIADHKIPGLSRLHSESTTLGTVSPSVFSKARSIHR